MSFDKEETEALFNISTEDELLLDKSSKEGYADSTVDITLNTKNEYNPDNANKKPSWDKDVITIQFSSSDKKTQSLNCFSKDSMTSAIISCVSGSIGAIMLNLPKVYAIYGLNFAIIIQTLSALNAAYSSTVLARMSAKYPNAGLYTDLVGCVFGTTAKKVFNFFFLITQFGVQIAMNLTGNSQIMSLVKPEEIFDFGFDDKETVTSTASLLVSVCLVTIMLPLHFKNDTNALKNLNLLSVAALFFVMVVVVKESPDYIREYKSLNKVKSYNLDNPMLLLQNLGIFVFSYNLTTTYHVVKSSLANPNEKRLNCMGQGSVLTIYLPYLLIGTLGYYSMGDQTRHVDCFPNRPALKGSKDTLMKIGKCGLIVAIYVAYQMRIVVVKKQFFDFMKIKLTHKNNSQFVICFAYLPAICGWIYPKGIDWVSQIGAFSMSALIIGIPACMAAKEYMREEKWLKLVLVILWGLILMVIAIAAAISVLIKMITGESN